MLVLLLWHVSTHRLFLGRGLLIGFQVLLTSQFLGNEFDGSSIDVLVLFGFMRWLLLFLFDDNRVDAQRFLLQFPVELLLDARKYRESLDGLLVSFFIVFEIAEVDVGLGVR